MLNIPEVYQQGIDLNSAFTGVILQIDGVELLGNVETEFDEGHVYNVIQKWSGVNASVDLWNNTYSKSAPKFTFNNTVYRKDDAGTNKRVSDDLVSKVGSEAVVYFVNNKRATSLGDCLQPFSGTIQSISEYDEKTISIGIISNAVLGDTKILTSAASGSIGNLLGNEVPIPHKSLQAPKVFGDYKANMTGLAKGLRMGRYSLNFIFSDHRMKEMSNGMLFFSHGESARATSNPYSTFTEYATDAPYSYMHHTPPPDESPSRTETYYHLTEMGDDLKAKDDGFYVQPTRALINDGVPENLDGTYNEGNLTLAKVIVKGTLGGRKSGGIAWETNDADDFKKQILLSDTNPELFVKFANFYGVPIIDGVYPTRNWILWYNTDLTHIVRFKEQGEDTLTHFQRNTGGVPHRSFMSQKLTGEYFRDQIGSVEVNRNIALGYYVSAVAGDAVANNILASFGSAMLEMHFLQNIDLDEEEQGLLIGWGHVQGMAYPSWITTFTDAFNGTSGGTPLPGRLIETGPGIIASLFIDRFPGEKLLSASADNFDFVSFGQNLFSGLRMRLNVLDDDDTPNKVMTRLGHQAPWTGIITPAGQVKFVSARTTMKISQSVATIKYEDLKNSLKIGLTDEKNVVNHLTIRSRWYGEQNNFMDEVIVKNTESIAQYGTRKKIVEWKNICSEQHVVDAPIDTDGSNGSTTASLGGSVAHRYIGSGIKDTGTAQWTGNATINDPIEYMKSFLMGTIMGSDTPSNYKGLLSHQHNQITKVTIPGTSMVPLELGDKIEIDDEEFAAKDITVFGESFENKEWLITDYSFNEKQMVINKAIEVVVSRLMPIPAGDEAV